MGPDGVLLKGCEKGHLPSRRPPLDHPTGWRVYGLQPTPMHTQSMRAWPLCDRRPTTLAAWTRGAAACCRPPGPSNVKQHNDHRRARPHVPTFSRAMRVPRRTMRSRISATMQSGRARGPVHHATHRMHGHTPCSRHVLHKCEDSSIWSTQRAARRDRFERACCSCLAEARTCACQLCVAHGRNPTDARGQGGGRAAVRPGSTGSASSAK